MPNNVSKVLAILQCHVSKALASLSKNFMIHFMARSEKLSVLKVYTSTTFSRLKTWKLDYQTY